MRGVRELAAVIVVATLLAVVGGFVRLIQLVRQFERRDLGGES